MRGPDAESPGLKAATVSGVRWIGAAQLIRQAVVVVSGLLIARWVGPGPAGVVALANSVMNFANLFKDAGTTAALLQARDPSPRLVSSLFWLNASLGLGLTALLAALAWPLAHFTHEPSLTGVLAALALVLLLSSACSVQSVLLERAMAYRGMAIVDAISAIAGCIVGVAGARAGWTHWSLVAQALVQGLLACVGTWTLARYRPRLVVDTGELRTVMGFSTDLMTSNGLNYIQRNADNFVVQHALGTVATGIYTRAYLALVQPLQQVCAVMGRIAHPVLLRVRDEPERFASIWLRLVGTMAVASFPLSLGLAAVAPEFTRGVLGPAWEPAIPLLRLFSCMGLMQSLMTMSAAVVQVRGRSDLMLRHALVMTPILLGSFLFGVQWGLLGITLAQVIASSVSATAFVWLTLRLAGVGWLRLWDAVKRPLIVSGTSCGLVALTGPLLPTGWAELTRLGLLVGEGVLLYVLATWMLNREQALELLELARSRPSRA